MSVVIASVNGSPHVTDCVEALLRQEGGHSAEVLVVDRCGEETQSALRSRFPEVRVIPAKGCRSLPSLRALGIAASRGRVVAVLADRFVPEPGWLAAIEDAHRSGHEVVGGAVENASERLLDSAVFLCEYAPFMPPLRRGPAQAIPGNNAVYDRRVLDRLGPGPEWEAWDSFLHARIRALGVTLWAEPELRVTQRKACRYGSFLRQRYHASRAFGGTRMRNAPVWRRLLYACATPLLPPLLMARLAAVVFRKRRHRMRLLKAAPVILTFLLSGAWGEGVGALLGPGDSLERLD